jgi:hypothetical protein
MVGVFFFHGGLTMDWARFGKGVVTGGLVGAAVIGKNHDLDFERLRGAEQTVILCQQAQTATHEIVEFNGFKQTARRGL